MNYLDTASNLEPIVYEYRITTIDTDGNLNPGTSLQTQPNPTAVSGNITGHTTSETSFRAGHRLVENMYNKFDSLPKLWLGGHSSELKSFATIF